MTISVRRAKAEDIPWLLTELKKFSEFFTSSIPLFDPDTAEEILTNLVETQIIFVAVRRSVVTGTGVDVFHPIGFIAGALLAHPFNPKIRMLSEFFWWVQEEHRETRAGLLLLNEFTEFGKANADWIGMALEHFSPVNERCLLRRGYKFKERSFLLEVN
jgi:hypothetical protein